VPDRAYHLNLVAWHASATARCALKHER